MNIWLIQTGEPLPLEKGVKKMRTALLADKLVERGHSVLWWATCFDHFKKKHIFKEDTIVEINPDYKIFAIKGPGYKKNISLARFMDHRFVAWRFRKLSLKVPRPDIIVCSTPPHDLAYETVMFAKRQKIPIVVDVRDEWPDIFVEHIPGPFNVLIRLLLFKDFKMIREVCINATSLVSMLGALLNWALSKARREKSEKDRVFYLGERRANIGKMESNSRLSFLADISTTKFFVVFIGTFGKYCNPVILTEAAKRVSDKNIHFVLAGDGVYFEEVKARAEGLKNLTLTGWLTEKEILYLLSLSKAGVVPCSSSREAFPNKAFTYLSAGIPVISAFIGELKDIIEKYRIGFYYPPDNVDALVDCILKLYNNPELYKEMSGNARRVFDEMFDADKIYEDYARHVEMIAEKRN